MVIQDIAANDRAVVAVDADGELVDIIRKWSVTQTNRDELFKRIVVIDPAAGSETVSFNPLYLPEGGDIQGTASAVVFGFKAIGQEPPGSQSQWNAQTANILRNSVMLLIANGKALADLPILLSDNDCRDSLLENVESNKNARPEYKALLSVGLNISGWLELTSGLTGSSPF